MNGNTCDGGEIRASADEPSALSVCTRIPLSLSHGQREADGGSLDLLDRTLLEEWNARVSKRAGKNDLLIVVTSVGTEEQALDIAHALIRHRQAACVNLMPNVHSIYRWKGHVCDDGEFLLYIKTRAREFEAVRETIQKLNTYELPEVLAYRVDETSPAFAAWIAKATERPKKHARGKRTAHRKPAAAR